MNGTTGRGFCLHCGTARAAHVADRMMRCPDKMHTYASAAAAAPARTSHREPACRNCGHAAARHSDMGCDGCDARGRECIGYDAR